MGTTTVIDPQLAKFRPSRCMGSNLHRPSVWSFCLSPRNSRLCPSRKVFVFYLSGPSRTLRLDTSRGLTSRTRLSTLRPGFPFLTSGTLTTPGPTGLRDHLSSVRRVRSPLDPRNVDLHADALLCHDGRSMMVGDHVDDTVLQFDPYVHSPGPVPPSQVTVIRTRGQEDLGKTSRLWTPDPYTPRPVTGPGAGVGGEPFYRRKGPYETPGVSLSKP